MYYLVRDYYDETELKIFSDKDDIEEWVDQLDEEKRVQLLVYNWEDGMHSDCRCGKRIYFDQYFILKKSKEVADFVEQGDLIEFKGLFGTIKKVIGYERLETTKYILVEGVNSVEYDNIMKIYKPNKKGDYIKVWEKENENEKG